jgi:transposase
MGARGLAIRTDLHTAQDLRRLAKRETVPRAARRLLAIANAMDGMSRARAARAAGIERQSLCDAVKNYNATGVAGLYDKPKAGRRPRLASAEQGELKAAILAGPPAESGRSSWTLPALCRLVEERFGKRYSKRGMAGVVTRLGLSKQKTRPVHPERDAKAQTAFKEGALRAARGGC